MRRTVPTEEVTFFKTRSNGAKTKRVIPMFRFGGWKEWLTFVRDHRDLEEFMDYDKNDPEDQLVFAEDIRSLLTGDDLHRFNALYEQWSEANMSIRRALYQAIVDLTEYFCPGGTREILLDEIRQLKKDRNMTVIQYAQQCRELIGLVRYLSHSENAAVSVTDELTMFKCGIPPQWQLEANCYIRSWSSVKEMENRFTPIERNSIEYEQFSKGKRDGKHHHADYEERKGCHPKSNQTHSSPRAKHNGQRSTGGKAECQYCRAHNFIFKNHTDDKCFKNPSSSSYKPARKSSGSGGDMAALQTQVAEIAAILAIKKQQHLSRRRKRRTSSCRSDPNQSGYQSQQVRA